MGEVVAPYQLVSPALLKSVAFLAYVKVEEGWRRSLFAFASGAAFVDPFDDLKGEIDAGDFAEGAVLVVFAWPG
jgi:hypothetical protein